MVKKSVITMVGGALTALGVIFIVVPGPAILFLPVGLAILSLEYPWAKRWLKKCQRMMSTSARKLDAWLLKQKHKR